MVAAISVDRRERNPNWKFDSMICEIQICTTGWRGPFSVCLVIFLCSAINWLRGWVVCWWHKQCLLESNLVYYLYPLAQLRFRFLRYFSTSVSKTGWKSNFASDREKPLKLQVKFFKGKAEHLSFEAMLVKKVQNSFATDFLSEMFSPLTLKDLEEIFVECLTGKTCFMSFQNLLAFFFYSISWFLKKERFARLTRFVTKFLKRRYWLQSLSSLDFCALRSFESRSFIVRLTSGMSQGDGFPLTRFDMNGAFRSKTFKIIEEKLR